MPHKKTLLAFIRRLLPTLPNILFIPNTISLLVLFFFLMIRRPRRSTLFPSTTLFRFKNRVGRVFACRDADGSGGLLAQLAQRGQFGLDLFEPWTQCAEQAFACLGRRDARRNRPRSEEHTSELQSHLNIVCRLLLEKKK